MSVAPQNESQESASGQQVEAASALAVKSDAATPPAQQAVQIDDAQVQACYANFCRVTGTPEELVVDFALNSQPLSFPSEPLRVSQRLVMNYFTAKRLLHALHLTLQRHEATFGVLEVDVQKRIQNPRG